MSENKIVHVFQTTADKMVEEYLTTTKLAQEIGIKYGVNTETVLYYVNKKIA